MTLSVVIDDCISQKSWYSTEPLSHKAEFAILRERVQLFKVMEATVHSYRIQ